MTATAEPDHFSTVIARAFPGSLAEDARTCASIIPAAPSAPAGAFTARIGNEALILPYRIYNDEPDPAALDSLDPRAQTMTGCVYTRHHDGYLRHRHVSLGSALRRQARR